MPVPASTGTQRVDPALARVVRRLGDTGILALALERVEGQDWVALDLVLEDVADWHDLLVREHGDRRAAAVSLATWVAAAPSLVIGLPVIVGGIVPEVDPSGVWLHRHPQGHVDRLAITPLSVRHGSLHDTLVVAAARIVQLTTPLVEQLCDRLPVGSVALWGGVADTIGAYALWFARQTGGDGQRAWDLAQRLLDGMAPVAPLRHRPRLFPVAWSGGTTHYPVRCTCCLYYRTAAADAREVSYCATCPLRGDESRNALLVAHLESLP